MKKMNTPWGVAHTITAYDPARTIVHAHTSEHGGIGVAHSCAMPDHLKRLGDPCGDWLWYEETLAWSIVTLWAPQHFSPATLAEAKQTLKDYFPELYTQHYGEVLTAADSKALEEREWRARTENNFVVTHAWGDHAWDVPPGHVYAAGWRRKDEATAGFLLPAAAYVRPGRLVLDGYPRWEPDRSLPERKVQNLVAVEA